MLYHLSQLLKSAPWTLLQYVTVRSAGALLTALLLSWMLGPRIITWLRELKFRQDYRPKDASSLTPDIAADLSNRRRQSAEAAGPVLYVDTNGDAISGTWSQGHGGDEILRDLRGARDGRAPMID